MTTSDYYKRTVANAQRLYTDSKLLCEHERAHSAVILGILALEEFGKALITKWDVKNIANKREFPTHVEKQTASFILLHATEIITAEGRKMFLESSQETWDFRKLGPLSEQFSWARAGFYEDLRLAATYADKQPKFPTAMVGGLGTHSARELHGYFEAAVKASHRPKVMKFASIIYMNGLGRL